MSKNAGCRILTDPLAGSLINDLRRASMVTLAALSETFATLGLRVIDVATIRIVKANPGCNQAEIGRVLGVQRTNMVPIVAALVDAGYIERRVADGRTHALHLTRKGASLYVRIQAASEQIEQHFFGEMDIETRAQLSAALRAIREKAPRDVNVGALQALLRVQR